MALVCPACRKIHLTPQIDPDTGLEIDICPRCYGMWFDAQELSKFFESHVLRRKFFLADDSITEKPDDNVVVNAARSCARCHQEMVVTNFGEVVIDICPSCKGLWLDEGELQRIVTEFEKGIRDEKMVSKELSKGLFGREERPNLGIVVKGILAFFKKNE
jgi:Zn-finger nucleic acid-binding protein